MGFLYEIFNNSYVKKALAQVVIPCSIADNLKFGIRSYQEEAFCTIAYPCLFRIC